MAWIYGMISALFYLAARLIVCAKLGISLAQVKTWEWIFGIDTGILILTLVVSPGFFLGILTVFVLKVLLYYCLYADKKNQNKEIRKEGS